MKKILHIDLKSKKIKTIHQYDEYKMNLNNNSLVFEAPSLAGYGIIGLNRLSVYYKDLQSKVGSHFAHFMKCNGYDYFIFEGESESPVYIYIDKENVSIKEATHIYNENYQNTQTFLEKELKNKKIEIASIGKAGANKIDFSKIIFKNNKTCGKDGIGKLMGSKNLKAIVLNKQENLIPYDTELFEKYNNIIAKRIINEGDVDWYDESNNCYGCYLNCENTSIERIKSFGFDEEEANKIKELSDIYGMDNITLAQGIESYIKTFDVQITDLENFIENIIKNYNCYKPLFINENKKIKNKIDSGEKLGFCKILLNKNILNEKEKKSLVKSVLGLSISI